MVIERFLIDSNSFITPYRQYYAFDLVPTFWDKLSKHYDRIILLDLVKNEIDRGDDGLTDWVNNNSFKVCNHKTPEIVDKYQEVLKYIQTCGFYNEKALHIWAQNHVALADCGCFS